MKFHFQFCSDISSSLCTSPTENIYPRAARLCSGCYGVAKQKKTRRLEEPNTVQHKHIDKSRRIRRPPPRRSLCVAECEWNSKQCAAMGRARASSSSKKKTATQEAPTLSRVYIVEEGKIRWIWGYMRHTVCGGDETRVSRRPESERERIDIGEVCCRRCFANIHTSATCDDDLPKGIYYHRCSGNLCNCRRERPRRRRATGENLR